MDWHNMKKMSTKLNAYRELKKNRRLQDFMPEQAITEQQLLKALSDEDQRKYWFYEKQLLKLKEMSQARPGAYKLRINAYECELEALKKLARHNLKFNQNSRGGKCDH